MSRRVRVYPHNDLFNLASYQRETINKKVHEGNEYAINLGCQACLISLAFATEALVNFVGHMKIDNWQERAAFRSKLSQVCDAANIEFDLESEPLSVIWNLKELRDSMAHGQPEEFESDAETREEVRAAMQCAWDVGLNPVFVNDSYSVVKSFKSALLQGCNISLGQSLTSTIGPGM